MHTKNTSKPPMDREQKKQEEEVRPISAAYPILNDLYAAFIGKNTAYFLPLFTKFSCSNRSFSTTCKWNWSGFLWPCIWLFYRKFYLLGSLSLLLSIVLNFMGWLISGLIVGAYGNYLYFQQATKKLTELQKFPSTECRLQTARLSGGTNIVLPLVLVIFLVVMLFLLSARAFFAFNTGN